MVLLSHFGRPKGKPVATLSLKHIVPALEKVLKRKVTFLGGAKATGVAAKIRRGNGVYLLENLRFHPGEEKNSPDYAKALAALGDCYVNDAFSCSHRAHASIEGITRLLPSAAGFALEKEIEALEAVLEAPKRPVAAVIGGAKVSTKIALLENLVTKTDHLIIGGAMANTFLAAQGKRVGASLAEPKLKDTAKKIMARAKRHKCAVHLPTEVSVAKELAHGVPAIGLPLDAIENDDMILDIGPKTIDQYVRVLRRCKTVLWNGPLGAFEVPPFERGTVGVARKVGELTHNGRMISVAGGGDTVAALTLAHAKRNFTYVSSAGGAFLEWLEGKTLPGVKALMV